MSQAKTFKKIEEMKEQDCHQPPAGGEARWN